jgi:hypothetical protein
MKFRIVQSLLMMAALTMVSCGDSKSGDQPSQEFSQDVRLISYNLVAADLHIDQLTKANGVEELTKAIRYAKDESKDKIQRVIEDSNFILKINGKKAGINISSQGKIERHGVTENAPSPDCQLKGVSTIVGEGSPLRVDLFWEFVGELAGPGCDTHKSELGNFLNAEMDALNLESVRDLVKATDAGIDSVRRIHLTLKIVGEGH